MPRPRSPGPDVPATATFTRADGKPETAIVRLDRERSGRPVAVTVTRDGKGRERERRIRYTGSTGFDTWAPRWVEGRAFIDLLKRGFVVAPPQPGPLQLFLGTRVGPPMGHAFAVDEGRGRAWLGDWGALRIVDLGTARVESIPLGNWRAVREVVVGPDGVPHVLAEFSRETGSSQWLAPDPSATRLAVLQVRAGAVKVVVDVRFRAFKGKPVGVSLSVAKDGTMLAPAVGGIGVYRANGALQKTFPIADTTQDFACAGMDPSGRWIACTRGDGRVAVVDRKRGTEHERIGRFKGVSALRVLPDGGVYVIESGGDYRLNVLPARGVARSFRIRAVDCAVSADGRTAFSVDDRDCAIFDLGSGRRLGAVPIAAMARHATLAVSDRYLYARTDLGCFQRVRLPTGLERRLRNGI